MFSIICFLGLVVFLTSSAVVEAPPPQNREAGIKPTAVRPVGAVKTDLQFSKFPLYFIANKGQVNKQARFYAKTAKYTLWLTAEGLVFDSTKAPGGDSHLAASRRPSVSSVPSVAKISRDVSRLLFVGANKNPEMKPVETAKLKVNYFKGSDKSKWHTAIPTSLAVLYKNLYKNIDLKVYGLEKQIEYDWIVKPGGNPADIQFEYRNAKKTHINDSGDLVVTTTFGELIHKKPLSYQVMKVEGRKAERQEGKKTQKEKIDVRFKKIAKNTYGFAVGDYDKNRELIIDPLVLPYSTYLGGSADDYGCGIAVDGSGCAYVTGRTYSTDFPVLGQNQADQTAVDAFVSKIDTTVSGAGSLLYSTYLGGAGSDGGFGIAVNNSGVVYVTGDTDSTDFPTLNQYQTDPGDSTFDAFLTKIDTTQTGSAGLLYSTYLGGNGADRGYGIAADNFGYAYVTGPTVSSDFPTVNQYQTYQGEYDVFVTKINTNQSGTGGIVYSTYLGGASFDEGWGIAIDGDSNAYVTGWTVSTDFPTYNEYMTDPGDGFDDAFVTRLDTNQRGTASLIYSTYLGGSDIEDAYGIATDGSGSAYVTGFTSSDDFPVTETIPEALPGEDNAPVPDLSRSRAISGALDSFVTRINTNNSGASSLIYSYYFGGTANDHAGAIAVDASGNAYATGYTDSTDFPLKNQNQGDQPDNDAFVIMIDTSLEGSASIVYSTYLGAAGSDQGSGIAVDAAGSVYVSGSTDSTGFPTQNQYQSDPGDGALDAFVAKLNFAALTVTSPNGGENWNLGATRDITWTAAGLSNTVKISLWKDGLLVGTIAAGIDPAAGSYSWTVGEHSAGTALPAGGCTVKIKETGTAIVDIGDAAFTITPAKITVTSPNGIETWPQGAAQNITWTAPAISGLLKITLWYKGGLVGVIATGVDPAAGTYAWPAGQHSGGFAPPNDGYTVKIKEVGTTAVDESDAPFTIGQPPSITVTSPNGGENWGLGAVRNITWISDGVSGSVKITLWKDGLLVGTIAGTLEPSVDTYAWTVGEHSGGTAPVGTGYTIKVKEKGTTVSDVNDAPFTITPSAITVTAPNGSENWPATAVRNITWTSLNVTALLKITLWKSGVSVGTIASAIDPAGGSYAWVVGQHSGGTADQGSDYTIKIKEQGTTTADESDAPFTIGPAPTITLSSPNGGENWWIGETQNITWTGSGISGSLKITLWKDGVLVGIIVSGLEPSINSHSWNVGDYIGGTAAPGTGYTIKVKEQGTTVLDESDTSFTIGSV